MYRKLLYVLIVCALVMMVFVSCEEKTETTPEVRKSASGLDSLLQSGVKLEKITD